MTARKPWTGGSTGRRAGACWRTTSSRSASSTRSCRTCGFPTSPRTDPAPGPVRPVRHTVGRRIGDGGGRAGGVVLHVHRAERADTLARALADLLAVAPADPFAVEVVAVPTRGVERWLTQRLSHRLGARGGHGDGICAAVRFPGPAAL